MKLNKLIKIIIYYLLLELSLYSQFSIPLIASGDGGTTILSHRPIVEFAIAHGSFGVPQSSSIFFGVSGDFGGASGGVLPGCFLQIIVWDKNLVIWKKKLFFFVIKINFK